MNRILFYGHPYQSCSGTSISTGICSRLAELEEKTEMGILKKIKQQIQYREDK